MPDCVDAMMWRILTLSLVCLASTDALSVRSSATRAPALASQSGRREALGSAATAAAAFGLSAALGVPLPAAAAGGQVFEDDDYKLKFEVPADWKLLSDGREALSDGRRLVIYTSPDDKVRSATALTPRVVPPLGQSAETC